VTGAAVLPPGAIGRFAVVKLWPEIKTAEDECIARLKIAAAAIGVECFEVNADGSHLNAPELRVSPETVDFVLHLHYDTPKLYDAFSLVALWNPTQFYHEWGYQRTSRNLITHDDFVSCNSRAADDHVARMVHNVGTHLPAAFHLYHSLDQVVHGPSLGDGKLFYAGINWEAVTGGQSRHQEVLKRLDQTGALRIYGPTIFQGVKVWDGYQGYVREIPFDGISMVHEIHKAGLALVLSSQAHKDSELMSNRLFESVAAGALVICDENPFAKRFFGDSLLYIDSRNSVEQIAADIQAHMAWAAAQPEAALAMIAKAQAIFDGGFSLRGNLLDLYHGLPARRQALDARQRDGKPDAMPVTMFLLMPTFALSVLDRHLQNVAAQTHDAIDAVLVIASDLTTEDKAEIEQRLAAFTSHARLVVREASFERSGLHGVATRRPLGAVMNELLEGVPTDGAFMFVAPNETLFSNHVRVVANALVQDPTLDSVAASVILQYGTSPIHGIHDIIDFTHIDSRQPHGFARFLFRSAGIDSQIGIALPYLDRKVMAVLSGAQPPKQLVPSTVVIDALQEFPSGPWSEAQENAVLADFCPPVFRRQTGFIALLPGIHVPQTRTRLLVRVVRKLMNRRWVIGQFRALRQRGLAARLQVLKRKLS